MVKKIENIIKTNSFINKMFTFFGSLVIKTIGLFVREEKNSVLFVSYMGKNYNDSPRLIYEAMINDPAFKNYKFYWAFKDVEKYDLKGKSEIVKIDTFKYFVTSLKTSCWITNVNIERGLHYKKSYTTYVNTWHGIPYKKVGNDVAGRNDFDFSKIDYFPYSGAFEESIYKRAFNLNDTNLKMNGMPRNDIVLNNDLSLKTKVEELYGVKEKTLILYAPTWRDEPLRVIDVKKWEEALGDDYRLLVRAHGITGSLDVKDSSFVVDVSDYEETADLLIASDILVTDYSSIMFDFSLTKKPIYIYAYDYDEYISSRGVYFDLKQSELNVYEHEDELINDLKHLDLNVEKQKTEAFRNEYFEVVTSDSTKKVIEFLKENL